MSKIPATQPFNVVSYARMNKLKLAATVNMKDKSKIYMFSNKNDLACFHVSLDRKILSAKGARGSRPTIFETVMGIVDKFKNNIESISTNVK